MQQPVGQAIAVLLPILAALLRAWEKSGGDRELLQEAEKVACECICRYSESSLEASGFLWGLLCGCLATGFACKHWFTGSVIVEEAEAPADLVVPPPERLEGVRTPSRRDGCPPRAHA